MVGGPSRRATDGRAVSRNRADRGGWAMSGDTVLSGGGILGTFAGHAFLRGLSQRDLLALASAARPFTTAAGQYLAREGEPAHAFYLIQSGHLALETRSPEGGQVSVQTAGPGEVVGWSWLVPPYRWQF